MSDRRLEKICCFGKHFQPKGLSVVGQAIASTYIYPTSAVYSRRVVYLGYRTPYCTIYILHSVISAKWNKNIIPEQETHINRSMDALARTLKRHSDVSATYSCLHRWIIDTYYHTCVNTIEQSDDDVVMRGIRVQKAGKHASTTKIK